MAARFKELRFGFASAEHELATAPELLMEGYYDYGQVIPEAMKGPRFLFLGYKGSGKSAIGAKLKLKAESDPHLFVSNLFLSDFPFTSFKKIVSGDAEPESRYPTAWSWLILILLLQSLTGDEGIKYEGRLDYSKTISELQKLGLLPAPSLKQLVLASSKQSFKANLTPVLEAGAERVHEGQDLQLYRLTEHLKQLIAETKTVSRHLIVLDGLDDILTAREIQYSALAALVLEVSRLNATFAGKNLPFKIIVLCRTDLYEKLPGPNKNKIRQDGAIQLDWYHDPRELERSKLLELVNLRARLVDPEILNVVKQFFPPDGMGNGLSNYDFLFNLTRHTPRDFVQLMVHIQQYAVDGVLDRNQVLSGARDYSINYFLPEIKDELVGHVSTEDIEGIFALIGSLREREFTVEQLRSKANKSEKYADMKLEPILDALFNCSAIGNIHNRRGGTTYFTFRFRNRSSTLNMEERFMLHRGIWKSLNLT